jgi:hypothetical protein
MRNALPSTISSETLRLAREIKRVNVGREMLINLAASVWSKPS